MELKKKLNLIYLKLSIPFSHSIEIRLVVDPNATVCMWKVDIGCVCDDFFKGLLPLVKNFIQIWMIKWEGKNNLMAKI